MSEAAMTPEMEAKETIEMVDFMVEFGNGLDKSLEDNKLGVLDLVNFYSALNKAGPAFKDFKIKDIAAMSAEAKALVFAHVGSKLALKSERTEEIVIEALATAMQVDKLIKAIKR